MIWFKKIKRLINLNYLSIFCVTFCFVLANKNCWGVLLSLSENNKDVHSPPLHMADLFQHAEL